MIDENENTNFACPFRKCIMKNTKLERVGDLNAALNGSELLLFRRNGLLYFYF